MKIHFISWTYFNTYIETWVKFHVLLCLRIVVWFGYLAGIYIYVCHLPLVHWVELASESASRRTMLLYTLSLCYYSIYAIAMLRWESESQRKRKRESRNARTEQSGAICVECVQFIGPASLNLFGAPGRHCTVVAAQPHTRLYIPVRRSSQSRLYRLRSRIAHSIQTLRIYRYRIVVVSSWPSSVWSFGRFRVGFIVNTKQTKTKSE